MRLLLVILFLAFNFYVLYMMVRKIFKGERFAVVEMWLLVANVITTAMWVAAAVVLIDAN